MYVIIVICKKQGIIISMINFKHTELMTCRKLRESIKIPYTRTTDDAESCRILIDDLSTLDAYRCCAAYRYVPLTNQLIEILHLLVFYSIAFAEQSYIEHRIQTLSRCYVYFINNMRIEMTYSRQYRHKHDNTLCLYSSRSSCRSIPHGIKQKKMMNGRDSA